jgi:transcription antitermination factor NusG
LSPIVDYSGLTCRPPALAASAESSSSWYALRIRSKFEKLACAALRAKGFEEFLPLYKSRRQWSDRVKEVESPLFPGYLFCKIALQDGIGPILTTPGFISIVGIGNAPVAVPNEEITSIRLALQSGLPLERLPLVSVGSRVLIERGPLAGIEGIALTVHKKFTLIVSITLLQRSLAVEIDRECARLIPNEVILDNPYATDGMSYQKTNR